MCKFHSELINQLNQNTHCNIKWAIGHVRSQQAEEVIEVATILKGTKTKLLTNLARLVTSMLDHSLGSNIKLTILSDPEVGKCIRNY